MGKLPGRSARNRKWQDAIRDREPSPRLKTAIRLHATGIAKSKKEAAEIAGISYNQMAVMTAPSVGNEKVNNLYEGIEEILADRTIDMSSLMKALAEEGVRQTAKLMMPS